LHVVAFNDISYGTKPIRVTGVNQIYPR